MSIRASLVVVILAVTPTANCFAATDASWRLMERVGMRREAYMVRESLHRSGEWLDGVGYALLADEWHARHQIGAPRG